MEFNFTAKDQKGSVREGKVDAISRDAAIKLLQSQGLLPLTISQPKESSEFMKSIQHAIEGVSEKELVMFFEQLAILIDAKVPIVSALQAIEVQVDNKFLKTITRELKSDIEDGMSLSEALGKHPEVFTTFMTSMVRTGEISGNLHKTIRYISENIEKNYELSSKVKGALIYPAVVISIAIVVGFIVVTVVLPKLTQVIKDLQVTVPWYTRVLMNSGDFMKAWWWAVLLGMISFVGGMMYYVNSGSGKNDFDQIKLKIPVIGNLFKYVYVSRFASNLAVLLAGGIPVVKSLTIVSEVINNVVYRDIVLACAEEVKVGGSISTVLAKSSDIPPILSRMVKVGEDAGKLNEVLEKVAGHYDRESDRLAKNLTTLIEPLMMVVLGLGVAVMVFGVLMPIYDITNKF